MWDALNICHTKMDLCDKVAKSKFRHLAVEEARAVTETIFQAYGHPLTNVALLKYLV